MWAGRDSNPQNQLLANGYCPLLCDHQPTPNLFYAAKKTSGCPKSWDSDSFFVKNRPGSLLIHSKAIIESPDDLCSMSFIDQL